MHRISLLAGRPIRSLSWAASGPFQRHCQLRDNVSRFRFFTPLVPFWLLSFLLGPLVLRSKLSCYDARLGSLPRPLALWVGLSLFFSRVFFILLFFAVGYGSFYFLAPESLCLLFCPLFDLVCSPCRNAAFCSLMHSQAPFP